MIWRAPQEFWAYMLLQLPDVLLAGLVLYLLNRWTHLPGEWAIGFFAGWLVKDIAMYPLLRRAFAPSPTGPEAFIGLRAVVVERLSPEGYVRLGGELWSAENLDSRGSIAVGHPVIVRAAHGLRLLVEAERSNGPRAENRGGS